jgi:hypothetical protein
MAHLFTKSLYGIAGIILLVIGISVALLNTGLMPAGVKEMATRISGPDLNALHLLQEFSALMVFAGIMCLWFTRHYEQSEAFHWALTAFWALFAVVHWFDVRGMRPSLMGPLINTIPFTLFLIAGLWRKVSATKRAEQAVNL